MFCRKVLEQRDSVYEKISQYLLLKNTIQSLKVNTPKKDKRVIILLLHT